MAQAGASISHGGTKRMLNGAPKVNGATYNEVVEDVEAAAGLLDIRSHATANMLQPDVDGDDEDGEAAAEALRLQREKKRKEFKIPRLPGGEDIDLEKLKSVVEDMGGFEAICEVRVSVHAMERMPTD